MRENQTLQRLLRATDPTMQKTTLLDRETRDERRERDAGEKKKNKQTGEGSVTPTDRTANYATQSQPFPGLMLNQRMANYSFDQNKDWTKIPSFLLLPADTEGEKFVNLSVPEQKTEKAFSWHCLTSFLTQLGSEIPIAMKGGTVICSCDARCE
jgi:hypothetical protein